MADPGASAEARSGALRFLTFRMGERLYALPAEEVAEVIRIPAVARLPQAPRGLMGLANLRGAVLPVASLRGLLGEGSETGYACRAVVLDGAAPVALAVDSVEALVSVEAGRVQTAPAEIAAEPGERLRGAFQTAGRGPVAKVLDLATMLEAAFARVTPTDRRAGPTVAAGRLSAQADDAAQAADKLVTFDVAGQEFALPLETVQEVITAPGTVAAVPRAEAVVLGVAAYRDTLLPLLSLRTLLGFPPSGAADGREKVLVMAVGGVLVGLVADRMRAILPVDPAALEPTPPMLAARTGGESRIKAIYRAEGGRRLISILSPDQLFREDVMQRLGTDAHAAQASAGEAAEARQLQVLVFRLGEDEFGLPIDVVDEVARVPEKITRVPKTPKFLEGVVNLRGDVLPVVDQRRRFEMPPLDDPEGRRLVVVRTERHRAGLIVDSVSEVLRTTEAAIEAAPHLAGEVTRLVHGVVNLEDAGRMILLLDPAELLTRAERGLLDAFQADAQAAP